MAPDLGELQPLCLPGTTWMSRVRRQARETVQGSTLHGSFTFLLRLPYNLCVFHEQCRLNLHFLSQTHACRKLLGAVVQRSPGRAGPSPTPLSVAGAGAGWRRSRDPGRCRCLVSGMEALLNSWRSRLVHAWSRCERNPEVAAPPR